MIGRLRRPAKVRKATNLQIRLQLEEHRALSREAALSGLSTSAWARMKLLEVIRKREESK